MHDNATSDHPIIQMHLIPISISNINFQTERKQNLLMKNIIYIALALLTNLRNLNCQQQAYLEFLTIF